MMRGLDVLDMMRQRGISNQYLLKLLVRKGIFKSETHSAYTTVGYALGEKRSGKRYQMIVDESYNIVSSIPCESNK